MFKANINDIQTALHDEKCGGDDHEYFGEYPIDIDDSLSDIEVAKREYAEFFAANANNLTPEVKEILAEMNEHMARLVREEEENKRYQ